MSVTVLERLWRRMIVMVSTGRLNFVDDSGAIQKVQADFGPQQIVDDVPVPHHFGFSSRAPAGSDVISVSITGDRSKTIILAINNKEFRFKELNEGEVVMYDKFGHSILLDETGITMTGDTKIIGNLITTGTITDLTPGNVVTVDQLRTAYNLHVHPVVGVTPGGATVDSTTTSAPVP